MKTLIKTISLTTSVLLLASVGSTHAQEASSLSELLNLVEQDGIARSEAYDNREREFQNAASEQDQVLNTARERVAEQESMQTQLSDQFEANEIIIADKREILRDRRGDLNELFGTLQGVAGDFMATFTGSIISAQYPGRTEFLEEFIDRAGSTTEQLAIEEIERFWFFMQPPDFRRA